MYAATCRRENLQCRRNVLGLEIAVEGIGEERHRRALRRTHETCTLAPGVLPPAREAAPRAQPRVSLRPLAQAGNVIAQIGKPWPACSKTRVTREIANEPVAARGAMLCHARGLHFDLHARHVHAGRAFAAARLARDAKRKRLRQLVR